MVPASSPRKVILGKRKSFWKNKWQDRTWQDNTKNLTLTLGQVEVDGVETLIASFQQCLRKMTEFSDHSNKHFNSFICRETVWSLRQNLDCLTLLGFELWTHNHLNTWTIYLFVNQKNTFSVEVEFENQIKDFGWDWKLITNLF